MAIAVKAITLVQGSKDFHVKGITLMLAGPTPNDTPPLITPPAETAKGPIVGSSIVIKPQKDPL